MRRLRRHRPGGPRDRAAARKRQASRVGHGRAPGQLVGVDLQVREQRYFAAFKVFDVNGDGRICVDELESLIRHCGAGRIDEPADALLAAADRDARLSLPEFRAALGFLSR
ncbi:EF-hand domain-containing protein [Streptomyces gardneri]|uniref:EF-hand domain-containing protein n=1 Tax=Nocardia sputi TaxID=2943705 RepID=UPI0018948F53|nr:EF-hand domain-containing protein [Nocardia sputi]MBF6165747.1 EF-hand domain-containing protein [Streptomyces gardneri]MBF6203071.1 EF-hand domain-containing protein [Streptomyces gardneri]